MDVWVAVLIQQIQQPLCTVVTSTAAATTTAVSIQLTYTYTVLYNTTTTERAIAYLCEVLARFATAIQLGKQRRYLSNTHTQIQTQSHSRNA